MVNLTKTKREKSIVLPNLEAQQHKYSQRQQVGQQGPPQGHLGEGSSDGPEDEEEDGAWGDHTWGGFITLLLLIFRNVFRALLAEDF